MTTRERLHELIDETAAHRLLAAALALAPDRQGAGPGLPALVGSLHSGHTDTAARSEEILQAELGDRASSS